MKTSFPFLISLCVVSFFGIGCQTTEPDKKLSARTPEPAKPTPAWTKKKPVGARSEQQLLITTKFFEVTRPTGSAEIPKARYQRKLTDPQYQMLVREFNQTKGTDIMSAPSVVTRDGQQAKVEVIREFVYPSSSAEDAVMKKEPVGVTLHIDARKAGRRDIALNTFARVTEFDGYSAESPEFDVPVFNRRDVEASSVLKSGQTMLIGGILDEESQEVQEKGPLGIIKKNTTVTFCRELIIAVSATLIDSDGQRIAMR